MLCVFCSSLEKIRTPHGPHTDAQNTSMSQQPQLRLPPFFPRVPQECKAVAATFFECFSPLAEYDVGKVRAGGREGGCAWGGGL